jgi:integrase
MTMAKRIRPRDERNLTFRKGTFWVDIQVGGRRIREFAGSTLSEARLHRDKLRTWGRDERRGLPARRPEGPAVTFTAWADDYLNLYGKRNRPGTLQRDSTTIKHLKAFFAGKLLKDVTPEAVERYRASRDGIAVVSRNRELATLRAMLHRAVELGRLQTYPLPKTMRLMEREPGFRPHIIEAEEADRILAASDKNLGDFITILLNTGLRKSELRLLRREDVDFDRAELTVSGERAKNHKPRTIPMNPIVIETLKSRPAGIYFFERESGKAIGDPMPGFRAAVKRAGIKARVRIHDLRDTFATWALRAGVDVRTVAELIGDTPAITLARYCHTDERTMRAAVDLVAEFGQARRRKVHDGRAGEVETPLKSVN